MKKIPTNIIPETESLGFPIISLKGDLLFDAGEPFYLNHVEVLKRVGIEEVVIFEVDDDWDKLAELIQLEKTSETEKLPLKYLRKFHRLAQNLYSKQGLLVAKEGEFVTMDVHRKMAKLGIEDAVVFLSAMKKKLEDFEDRKQQVIDAVNEKAILSARIRGARVLLAGEKMDAKKARELSDEKFPSGEGKPLEMLVKVTEPGSKREERVLHDYKSAYEECFNHVSDLFAAILAGEKRDTELIQTLLARLLVQLVKDRDLFSQLANFRRSVNYNVEHALNVSLLAINVASALKYNAEEVLEIACAAIFANLGKLKLHRGITEKVGPLTEAEWRLVRESPQKGVELIKNLKNVPRTTPVVIFQIHERADGSGYPNGSTIDTLHPFSRIISVCDVYDALTHERSYRPAMLPPDAMETVLHMASKGELDRQVVEALVSILSLYPIGTWLELDNRFIGPVIATNHGNGARPVMKVVFEKRGAPMLKEWKLVNLAIEHERRVSSYHWGSDFGQSVFIGF
ncbi:MAG: hypothetical protein NUW37_10180 [Planctomycetes bacterium]|nr:hypothetical protein [Planctomycetota bacterium]